jgi:hypothetical protein
MKVAKGTVESKFITESETAYIYQSVSSVDFKTDSVDFVVSGVNGDEYGRFETLEEATGAYDGL